MGLFEWFFGGSMSAQSIAIEDVEEMERIEKESAKQLELVKRYTKAEGRDVMNRIEAEYIRRLGKEITRTQKAVFRRQGNKLIAEARLKAQSETQKAIQSYTRQLMDRGGRS